MRAHGSWRPRPIHLSLDSCRATVTGPTDLLSLVLERLPWSTHPSFGAACRNWRSVVAPFYPAWVTPVLLSAADVGSTNLRFYSPYYHKNFEVSRTLEAPGAKFCCAAGRHLTLCQRSKVLEADLVTGDVHELPPSIYGWFHFVVYDGGAEPERMFGVHTIGHPRTALTVKDDDGEWDDWDYALVPDSGFMEASPNTNPILHGGSLYVLFDDGKLAVYDESLHCDDDGFFKILDKPSSFGIHKCDEEPEDKYICSSPTTASSWPYSSAAAGHRLYQWPDTVHVDIVDRHGELAFVPTSTGAGGDTKSAKDGANIWSHQHHQLGSEESTEFWDTEKLDYSIWVDFNIHIKK
ncbi:unnamed protein product [Miscanthus lutarioriparius]|uniref:Uncharacterized protein n=1 Tax=Miscanthus lutarioriparius TaxID=422564 RepID=A0A811NF01_9POAL|nr:unnamed protein product [Miscanthus lutarioriparius]